MNLLNNEELQDFKKYIIKGGPISIKLIQWYLSNNLYNKKINDTFNDLFNNCPNHSLETTKKMFKNDFNKDLNDIINIENLHIIGSGSIGQVYKCKFRNGQEIALKVKHPKSNIILENQKFIINFILFLQKIDYFRKLLNLHFNLKDFINDLYLQINFKNEVYNCFKIKKIFSNNKLVIIPKIYFYSNNIIIYSYEKGDDFNTLSEYKQRKLGLNFYSMIYKMVICDNFIHGDLHKENWKIRKVDNEIKIVLYDFGLCHQLISKNINQNVWVAFEEDNFENLFKNLKYVINEDHFKILTDNDIKDLKKIIYETSLKGFSLMKILNNIKCYFKKKNLYLNKNLFNILITMILLQDLFIKTKLVNNVDFNIVEKKKCILNRISDLSAFTKKYDFYNEINNNFNKRRENLINDIKNIQKITN